MKTRKLTGMLAGLCLVAGLGLSGCGQNNEAKDADSKAVVKIVTNGSWTLSEDSQAALTKATGQSVQLIDGEESGTLDSKLILRKDSPLGDMTAGLTLNNIRKVAEAGVFDDQGIEVPDSAKQYVYSEAAGALPVDRSDVCLNYDKAYFEEHNLAAPTTFDDLLKAEYHNLSVVIAPESSDTGFGMMLGTIQQYGTDGYLEYWQKLLANGAKVTSSWDEAYNQEFTQGEGEGNYPIVASYSSSPYWSVNEDGTEAPTANVSGTCYPAVEYVAVLKGASNAAGAKKVIEWLLSSEGQSAVMTDNITYPIDETVALDPKLEKFAPRPDNSQVLSPAVIDENRAQWIKDLQAVLG